MGLIEQLDALKDQPDRVELNEQGDIVNNTSAVKEPPKEEPAEDTPKAEPTAEEKAAEAETIRKQDEELEQKPEVRGYKERKIKAAEAETVREREARIAAEKRLDEALKGLTTRSEPKVEAKPEATPAATQGLPDAQKDPDGYVRYMLEQGKSANEAATELRKEVAAMKRERIEQSAQRELEGLESAYEKTNPHYRDAVKFAEDRIVAREKLLNPNVPESTVRANFQKSKLQLAVRFSAQGGDPVANLYKFVQESYGYMPRPAEEVTPTAEKGKTLDAVTKNKAKSASPLAGGGENGSNAGYGPESAKGMTVAQFANLTDEQKKSVFG